MQVVQGAAERTQNPEAKRMFHLLAKEEEAHNRILHDQFQCLR
jgi:rubrerythrin